MPKSRPGRFNTDFCLQVANHVMLKETEDRKNSVLSPFSLHLLLSLIAAGSSGLPLEQLLFFLKSPSLGHLNSQSSEMISLAKPADADEGNKGGPLLSYVNGVWFGYSLSPAFEEIAREVYKSEVKQVDFVNKADQIREEINTWAENATIGLIKNLLPHGHPSPQTLHACANALYFKGSWLREFAASETLDKDFHISNREVVQVPFITSKSKSSFLYGSYDGYKVVNLWYKMGEDLHISGEFCMYFLLPDKKHGLLNLIQNIQSNPGLLTKKFKLQTVDLSEFWIPRFRFEFQLEPKEAMIELGLEMIFPKDGKCIQMAGSLINNRSIFHKSCIEVNEEGTEAAAASYDSDDYGFCCLDSPPRNPVESFVADHPFVFMIREETTGTVFFTGAVLNPLLNC